MLGLTGASPTKEEAGMLAVTGMLNIVHCYNDASISSHVFGLSWTQHIQSFMMTCNGL